MQEGPPVVGEDEPRYPVSFGPRVVWLLIALLVIVVGLFAAWTYLTWSIAQHVYSTKADLSWFGITFYHGYTFLVGGLLALLVVNPKVGKSDVASLVTLMSRMNLPIRGRVPAPHRPAQAGGLGLGPLAVREVGPALRLLRGQRELPDARPCDEFRRDAHPGDRQLGPGARCSFSLCFRRQATS